MTGALPEGEVPWGPSEWNLASAHLGEIGSGSDADDYIEAVANRALDEPNPSATATLSKGLRLAASPFVRHLAALALAISAPSDDAGAVDSLVGAYREAAGDSYLGSALLEAMGFLALRSPLARSGAVNVLLRLRPADDSFLLIRGSKVIGRLIAASLDKALEDQLGQLVRSEDPVVRAEVEFQLAMAQLADVFLAANRTELRERMAEARASFARAHVSEEHRPDAAIFSYLLDMLLTLLEPAVPITEARTRLGCLSTELRQLVSGRGEEALRDYASEAGYLVAMRVLRVAYGLARATEQAAEASDWTDFGEALLNLAATHSLVAQQPVSLGDERWNIALSRVPSAVLAPKLGPVLLKEVGRHRLGLILRKYRQQHGEDEIASAMANLLEAAGAEAGSEGILDEVQRSRLSALADKVHMTTEALVEETLTAFERGEVGPWAERVGLEVPDLPVHHPELYHPDPSVDRLVRGLLDRARRELGPYERIKWDRLIEITVSVVAFAKAVRDDLPIYTRCAEDDGLGQTASEDNLQEALFSELRGRYGRNALYERQRVAGGRPDTGVIFPECEFPIEVKHEFTAIDATSIRANYISQADVYASARDRVSFLMILDLRASNAAAHQTNQRAARKRGEKHEPVSLYSLEDGFWIEVLPADPQLPESTPKVVIVGLVPGNLPLPSSRTAYSRRPRAKNS
ncbi:MAG: hypothetical protein ACYC0X_34955 [Pirellulaceae bacterium]